MFTYDGTTYNFYKDGVSVWNEDRVGDTIWNTATHIQVGGVLDGSVTYSSAGSFSDVAIYDYALTPSQVLNHYNKGIDPAIRAFSNDFESGIVGANQGVAYDGTYFYVTGGHGVGSPNLTGDINNNILKYDSNFDLITYRDVTSDNSGLHTEVSGVYYDSVTDHLLVGANNYNTTPEAGWIYEYNASDLSFIQAFDLGSRWVEACVLYGGNWFVVSANAHEIAEFDDSWNLIQVHSLPGDAPSGLYWQGIFIVNDVFYINYHEPQNVLWALKLDGSPRTFRVLTSGCVTPTEDCTQGVFRFGDALFWAERTASGGRVIRTNL